MGHDSIQVQLMYFTHTMSSTMTTINPLLSQIYQAIARAAMDGFDCSKITIKQELDGWVKIQHGTADISIIEDFVATSHWQPGIFPATLQAIVDILNSGKEKRIHVI